MPKKESFTYNEPGDLIREINPFMSAEEAIARIVQYNKIDLGTKSKRPLPQAHAYLLKRAGYEPNDWVFYTNQVKFDEETEEQMLERTAKSNPPKIEYLVLNGAVIGGMHGLSWVKHKYSPKEYSVFIRKQRPQLNSKLEI